MASGEPQFLTVGEGPDQRRIGVRYDAPGAAAAPTLFWLSGFKSDMSGTKAASVAAWASERGLGCLRFDYSGHGCSEGTFAEGTISRWLTETRTVFAAHARGSVVVIGSSMGGYLALLLARALSRAGGSRPARIDGLSLIAPAWNMTEELMWKRFPEEVRRQIREEGAFLRPSRYGDGPYEITRGLIEDGRSNLIGNDRILPGCPVEILHGRLDPDVPFAHSERLTMQLRREGVCVRLTPVDDGEHRLSRPQDLAALFEIVERLLSRSDAG